MWWSGPDDPNARVLKIEPTLAELWMAVEQAGAATVRQGEVTGEKPFLGENRRRRGDG